MPDSNTIYNAIMAEATPEGALLPAAPGADALPQPYDGGAQTPGRLGRFKNRLPRFNDDRQRKAARAIAWFFVLMLLLTLVVNGTAGATLPQVETQRPQSGEITQRVRGTGTVKAGDSFDLPLPAGLTLEEVLAAPGQSVAAGDPLARFDLDEIGEQLKREQAALEEKLLKLKQLQRTETHDASSLEAAQLRLQRAQADYDSAKAQGDADIAAAKQALADAEKARKEARQAIPDKKDKTSPEYQHWEAMKAAEEAAREAVPQTESRVADALLAAERTLQDARTDLANAEKADADTRQQAQDTAAQNNIEASTLQLDIDAQQEKVNTLQALKDAGGLLTADKAGTLQTAPQAGSKTNEGDAFRLSDPKGRYEAEMWVDQKEAEKLSPGDSCEVTLSGGSMYYRPTANGRVLAVGEAGDDGRVKVTIQLPESDWKDGQTVDAQMVQNRQTHSLCVPLSALHADNAGYYLLVLQEQETVLGKAQIAAKVPVSILAQDDQLAAVEGPLSDRDAVITGSNKAVQPGDTVRVSTS